MDGHISKDKNMLIKYNKYPHFIGAIPPFYNEKLKAFMVPKNGPRLCTLPIFLIVLAIDQFYLWVYVAPNVRIESEGLEEFMNFYLQATSRACGLWFGLLFQIQMKELMNFLNVVFNTEKYFEGKLYFKIIKSVKFIFALFLQTLKE